MKTACVLVLLLPAILVQGCVPEGNKWDIFLTEDTFSADDSCKAEERCRECGMQVCTLPQMKLAFEFEYRNLAFGLYRGSESDNRKARVSSCDYDFPSQECFYEGREILTVPLSDGEEVAAYCCPSTGPSLTVSKFHSHAEAKESCPGTGARLCPLVLLAYANNLGYATAEWGWYASPNLFANVEEDELVVCYDPQAGQTARAGYCCPMVNSFVLSEDEYATHGEAQAFCASMRLHLCSLAELKSARDHGFWGPSWGRYEVEGRDVKVSDCKYWSGPECYEGVIANTPRPRHTLPAYCCP
ncbi:uncharacterized protein LOC119725905 [Patiria miniata]|uniref:Uncharacterized protein n=1 Tax=Patiria miniata TaxID=46514 RepID=A0A913ZNX6_PATMI|nr:uncharacterized protein LOC119725905 [Patiria miniata]